ncbi:MAG: glycoside hydrolase family 16 protein [Eubacteriales bacterium]
MRHIRCFLCAAACIFLLAGCASTPVVAKTDKPDDVPSVQATQSPVTKTATPSPTPSPTPEPTPSPSPTPYIGPPAGYELLFADEFDVGSIDESIWGFETGPWPYNNELESYTRENAWIEDGSLVIEARKESLQNRDYTSARLTTQGKFDFTYGYLEVRAATPTGRGMWSAIWMLPTDLRYGGYLHSGEIDLAERVGYDAKRIHSTIHTFRNNAVNDSAISGSTRISRKDDGFHTYAILWEENAITILFDGVETLAYLRPDPSSPDVWPFDVPFHLILNIAVGGSWGGQKGIDDEALPQRMYVDYVRYYAIPAPAETP